MDTVTLTCPEVGDWFDRNNKSLELQTKTHEFVYNSKKKGPYHCSYGGNKRYSFYVQGKGE